MKTTQTHYKRGAITMTISRHYTDEDLVERLQGLRDKTFSYPFQHSASQASRYMVLHVEQNDRNKEITKIIAYKFFTNLIEMGDYVRDWRDSIPGTAEEGEIHYGLVVDMETGYIVSGAYSAFNADDEPEYDFLGFREFLVVQPNEVRQTAMVYVSLLTGDEMYNLQYNEVGTLAAMNSSRSMVSAMTTLYLTDYLIDNLFHSSWSALGHQPALNLKLKYHSHDGMSETYKFYRPEGVR